MYTEVSCGISAGGCLILPLTNWLYQIVLPAWSNLNNNKMVDNAVQVDGFATSGYINNWLLHSLPKRMGFKLLKNHHTYLAT